MDLNEVRKGMLVTCRDSRGRVTTGTIDRTFRTNAGSSVVVLIAVRDHHDGQIRSYHPTRVNPVTHSTDETFLLGDG